MEKAFVFLKERRGDIVLEFVIVITFLVLILGAIIDIGLMFSDSAKLASATRQTARVVGRQETPGWADYFGTYALTNSVSGPSKPPKSSMPQIKTYTNPGSEWVLVQGTLTYHPMSPILKIIGGYKPKTMTRWCIVHRELER